jgi:hypothetical protein
MTDRNVGVGGALSEAIRRLGAQVAPERIDTLWVFPPRLRGRTESGVIAAGCYMDGERRLLVTMAYQAEETGRGIAFSSSFHEEGEAPKDRLPQVIDGVVRRSAEEGGAPRPVSLQGDPALFQALIDELAAGAGAGALRTLGEPAAVAAGSVGDS